MKSYYYYSRKDKTKEPINLLTALSRLHAAKQFAARKALDLKTFLTIYAVSR
jgi:hypothetical protein